MKEPSAPYLTMLYLVLWVTHQILLSCLCVCLPM